ALRRSLSLTTPQSRQTRGKRSQPGPSHVHLGDLMTSRTVAVLTVVGWSLTENVFKPGAIIGNSPTLFGVSATIYAIGRLTNEPKVSLVGMDLLRPLVVSEVLTETLKYTTRRERPDGSGRNSFPSGHAADPFAFAPALERHLNWRFSVPAYVVASYVAASRFRRNPHFATDVAFCP